MDQSWAQQEFTDKNTQVLSHSKSPVEDLAILSVCNGVIMSMVMWWSGCLLRK